MPVAVADAVPASAMDLERTVALALEANISAQIFSERTRAADAVVKSRRTEFLPTFSTQYRYTRFNESVFGLDPTRGVIQPQEFYEWTTSLTQPLFTGFLPLVYNRVGVIF